MSSVQNLVWADSTDFTLKKTSTVDDGIVLSSAIQTGLDPSFEIRGILENINNRYYTTSRHGLYIIAIPSRQSGLPINSISFKINNKQWISFNSKNLQNYLNEPHLKAKIIGPLYLKQTHSNPQKLQFRATDMLGNKSKKNTLYIHIDNKSPSIHFKVYSLNPEYIIRERLGLSTNHLDYFLPAFFDGKGYHVGKEYQIIVQGFDSGIGIEYTKDYKSGSINLGSLQPVSSAIKMASDSGEWRYDEDNPQLPFSYKYTITEKSNYQRLQTNKINAWNTIWIQAQDKLGNKSEVKKILIFRDEESPEIYEIKRYLGTQYGKSAFGRLIDFTINGITSERIPDFVSWNHEIRFTTRDNSFEAKENMMYIRINDQNDSTDTSISPHWDEYQPEKPITFNSSGLHKVEIKSVDGAANLALDYIWYIYVVQLGPAMVKIKTQSAKKLSVSDIKPKEAKYKIGPNGLRYYVIEEQKGDFKPRDGDLISYHIEGWQVEVNNKYLDSKSSDKPIYSTLGDEKILKSLEEIVKLMTPGDIYGIIIPEKAAYGPCPATKGKPCGPLIIHFELLQIFPLDTKILFSPFDYRFPKLKD